MTTTPNENGDSRDPIELLAEQFLSEIRQGHATSIEDYQRRYPEYSEGIKALFPTLLMMEDLKPPSHRLRDSSDTLLDRNIKQLGDFHILRKIGYGGMGIVYAAQQQSLDRPVAIKVFAPTLFTSDRLMRRFKREAKAAGALHHTNIVPVLGVGEQWGIHFYIMQLIDGKSLDKVIRPSNKKMSTESFFRLKGEWQQIADIGRQLMSALHYAHSRNVLHRDLKPANIILDREGTAWITDFGLAKLTTEEGITKTGQAIGTLRYMAPEQLEGHIDERSDVYSLGLTLYELITWRPAFAESDHGQLVHKKTQELPPRPRSIDPSIPRDLETIILKAIARDPSDRYTSARLAEEDFERFLNDDPITARRVSSLERLVRWSRRNRALAAAATGLTLMAAVALFSLAWGYISVQNALAGERFERNRAITNATLAMGALDSVFDRFGIERISDLSLSNEPMLSTEAAALLDDLIQYYEKLAKRDANAPAVLLKAAEAQLTIGNIRQRLGEYDPAIHAYLMAIKKFDSLDSSPAVQVRIASIHNNIAWTHRTHGCDDLCESQLDIAKSILEESLKIAEGDSAIAFEAKYELARTHFLVGRNMRPGMGPTSLPPASAILDLDDGFGSEPDEDGAVPLDSAPATGVDHDSKQIRESERITSLDRAILLLRDMTENSNANAKYRRLLARCLIERVGDNLASRDEGDTEIEFQGIAIQKSLAKAFPNNTDYQLDLVESLAEFSVFSTALDVEIADAAEKRLRRALKRGQLLVAKRPDMALYSLIVAHAHFKLAAVYEFQAQFLNPSDRHQKLDAAEDEIVQAIDLMYDIHMKFPDAVGFAAWLAYFESRCGWIQNQLRRFDDAHRTFAIAIERLESMPTIGSTQKMLDFCYRQLNRTYREIGTPDHLLPDAWTAE